MDDIYGSIEGACWYFPFGSGWHHQIGWCDPKVWQFMWYAIDVQSLVVHTFHGMDKYVLTFGKVVNKKLSWIIFLQLVKEFHNDVEMLTTLGKVVEFKWIPM